MWKKWEIRVWEGEGEEANSSWEESELTPSRSSADDD